MGMGEENQIDGGKIFEIQGWVDEPFGTEGEKPEEIEADPPGEHRVGQNPRPVEVDQYRGMADPRGAAMYNVFAHGEVKATEGGSITEGIGLGRVTRIIENIKVDRPYLIPDEEAMPLIFDLLEHEGLCLGGSSGINIAGAIRLAKDMGPGHTIVTVLADHGSRYQSKLFNPAFLKDRNLPTPPWLEG